LGKHLAPGWVALHVDDIHAVLCHFSATNFLQVEHRIGKEVQGAPMGDALSGAVLRLWKWHRERMRYPCEAVHTLSHQGRRTQMVFLRSCCMLVLDVSYRDDIRLFCAWRSAALLQSPEVRAWGWKRICDRYHSGTMRVEEADSSVFIGLNTVWSSEGLRVWPRCPDPWVAAAYAKTPSTLKPWVSWAPPSQHKAIVRGLLCRARDLSSDLCSWHTALTECMAALVFSAGFPLDLVERLALQWSKTSAPFAHQAFVINDCVHDVQRAIHTVRRAQCRP